MSFRVLNPKRELNVVWETLAEQYRDYIGQLLFTFDMCANIIRCIWKFGISTLNVWLYIYMIVCYVILQIDIISK